MKHLFVDDNTLWNRGIMHLFLEIGHMEYCKKRIQFWKYRKHRTMGRPILMRWRSNKDLKESGKNG